MNCNECREKREQATPVPYIVHESAMARMERTTKRLWILLILVVVLLVGTNAAWIWYESQWEVVETVQEVTQQAEGNGNNRFVGGNMYVTPDSQDYDEEQDAQDGR